MTEATEIKQYPKQVHPEGGAPTIVQSPEEEAEVLAHPEPNQEDPHGLLEKVREELIHLAYSIKAEFTELWGTHRIRKAVAAKLDEQAAAAAATLPETPPAAPASTVSAAEVSPAPAEQAPATEGQASSLADPPADEAKAS